MRGRSSQRLSSSNFPGLPPRFLSWTPKRLGLALGVTAFSLLVAMPILGWPPTVRLSAVLVTAALLATLIAQPWKWRDDSWHCIARYEPSPQAIGISALAAALLLFWIVLTLFQGGRINAVDFTVYFDRPLYQTMYGRPLYVETTDEPLFEYRTHLGVHAYWLLLPLSVLYAVHATPLWLLALSVISVVAGSVYVIRIGRHVAFPGVLSCGAALTFLLNDSTARTLRYGFHPEVLYAWFVPWLIFAGLRSAKRSYLAATVACVLVKEDAILPLAAAVMTLAVARGRRMTWGHRCFFLGMPLVVALANLAFFYAYVVPALSPTGEVAYAGFWTNYGLTPTQALFGMLQQPHRVARDVAASGLLGIVLPPFAFLPILGWRWSIGVLPLVVIFGASASDQVRRYGVYYGIYLVPFLSLAAADGAQRVLGWMLPRVRAVPAAAALLAIASLVAGPGYALRPWRTEVAAVRQAIHRLVRERTVLVQSGLYPHAGYSARIQLLTPHALRDAANADAAILVARARMGAHPLSRDEITWLLQQPAIAPMPDGLVAIRNPPRGALGKEPDDNNRSSSPATHPGVFAMELLGRRSVGRCAARPQPAAMHLARAKCE